MSIYTEEQLKFELDNLLNNTERVNNNKLTNLKNKKVLVISGGSLKGIGALGAIKALKDLGCLDNIDEYAGTSIGSVICMLLCIGYIPEEIYEFILLLDFTKIKSINLDSIFKKFGIDSGEKVDKLLEKLIENKNVNKNITFQELYNKTKKKLVVTATCINDKSINYFSYTNVPNMSVLKAIRMSISIPIYFSPVEHEGKYYVDGGCIDNYPIHIYKDRIDEVFGLYMATKREKTKSINSVEIYLSNMIDALFEGVKCNSIKGYEDYTLKLETTSLGLVGLDVNNTQKQELFTNGYNTVMEYLNM